MKKRILALLLAGLMLTSTVACGTPDPDAGENETQTAVASVTEPEETDPRPDLPERDYGGDEFRILTDKDSYKYIVSEKTGGELVNDAILEANMEVSGQFNVKFSRVDGSPETYILAGDDAYDVAYLHDCETATMSLKKWFQNIYDIPYMDPTNPWWPQFTVDSLTLNGKMYFYSNYTGYRAMVQTRACLFNQSILTDYNVESPYDHVRAGTWTLDQAIKMSTSIYSDQNGNGLKDEQDLFGFASTQTPWGWLEAFGIELYQKDPADPADMALVIDDRVYTLIDKLHNWFYSGNDSVWVEFNGGGELGMDMFASNRSAFTLVIHLDEQVKRAIAGNIQYGIIPFPKIDENQKDYYGACTDFIFSIPITLTETERVGIILEAMAYAGYKYVRPAYCEQTLKTRFATDPNCAEMLNLILDNQVISFAYLFSQYVSGGGLQSNLIPQTVEQNNVASYLKSKQKIEEKTVKNIVRFYEIGR